MTEHNVFTVLAVANKEDCVSNALAHGLETSERFQELFLEEVCGRQNGAKSRTCQVHIRPRLGEAGIPDLLVLCDKPDGYNVVVVENKLHATEGKYQTANYASEPTCEALCDRFGLTQDEVDFTFCFLTLFPDQEPQDERWKQVEHEKLADAVLEANIDAPIVKDWCRIVKRFHEAGDLRAQDCFVEKMRQSQGGLNAGYLCFLQAMQGLDLPQGLAIRKVLRDNYQGRPAYRAIISKDSWEPGELSDENSDFDPCSMYSIHFEPEYQWLQEEFKLLLHYEVNPYRLQSHIERKRPNEWDEYREHRKALIQFLKKNPPEGWSIYHYKNMMGRAKLTIGDEESWGEVRQRLNYSMSQMAEAIDEASSGGWAASLSE